MWIRSWNLKNNPNSHFHYFATSCRVRPLLLIYHCSEREKYFYHQNGHVSALFAIYFPSLLASQDIFMVDNIGLSAAISFVAFVRIFAHFFKNNFTKFQPLIFILSGFVNSSSCATSTAHVRIWNTIALAVTACTLILLPISALLEFL